MLSLAGHGGAGATRLSFPPHTLSPGQRYTLRLHVLARRNASLAPSNSSRADGNSSNGSAPAAAAAPAALVPLSLGAAAAAPVVLVPVPAAQAGSHAPEGATLRGFADYVLRVCSWLLVAPGFVTLKGEECNPLY